MTATNLSAPGTARLAGVLLLAALVLLAVPVLVVSFPPLLDYPNHLARMWLIAGGASRFYEVAWSGAITNIGIDLVAATLGSAIRVEWLGTALIVAAFVLPPLGAGILNRTLFGQWHYWQIGFVLIAFSYTALAAFINFNIGLGLALMAAALDPRIARKSAPAAFAARFAIAAVLSIVHLFGVLLYAVLLAGLAFGPRYAPLASARTTMHAIGRGIAVGMTAGLALVLNLFLAPTPPGAQRAAGEPLFEWDASIPERLFGVLSSPFRTYDLKVDAAAVAVLAILAAAALLFGRIRTHAGLLLAATALMLIAVVIPSHVIGQTFIDRRFAHMAALIGLVSVRPELVRPRWAVLGATAAIFATVVLKTVWIAQVWTERQSDIAAVEKVLSLVPREAMVLPVEHTVAYGERRNAPTGRYISESLPTFWHYSALGLPSRGIFVPNIFTAKGKQPLRVLSPADEVSVPEGRLASIHTLNDFSTLPVDAMYIKHWRTRFDYLLVLNADVPDQSGPVVLPPELSLVSDQGFAALYKIRRQGE